jgi:hypothetical protein
MINNSNSYGTDNASNNIDSDNHLMFEEKRPINQGVAPPPPPPLTSGSSLSPSKSLPTSSLISTPDRSSILADIKSGIGGINLKRVTIGGNINDKDNRRNTTGSFNEIREKEEDKGRFSTGMMGGSAVSAILARRKFLQEDESGSDNDSDDGWS